MSPIEFFEDVQPTPGPIHRQRTKQKQVRMPISGRTPLANRTNNEDTNNNHGLSSTKMVGKKQQHLECCTEQQISSSFKNSSNKRVSFSECSQVMESSHRKRSPEYRGSLSAEFDAIVATTSASKANSVPMTPNTARVENLNSLRRSLRDTIKSPKDLEIIHESSSKKLLVQPGKENKQQLHQSRFQSIIRKPNMIAKAKITPKTPKSLLKEEMEHDVDVSLLFSPHVVIPLPVERTSDTRAAIPVLLNADKNKVSVKVQSRLEMIAASVKARKSTENLIKTNGEIVLSTPVPVTAVSVSPTDGNRNEWVRIQQTQCTSEEKYTKPPSQSTNDNLEQKKHTNKKELTKHPNQIEIAKVLPQPDSMQQKSSVASRTTAVGTTRNVCNDRYQADVRTGGNFNDRTDLKQKHEEESDATTSKSGLPDRPQHASFTASKSQLGSSLKNNENKSMPLQSTASCASAKSTNSHWFSAMPASILHPNKTVSIQSFTPRGNGVRMDLTDIFISAATSKKPCFPVVPKSKASTSFRKRVSLTSSSTPKISLKESPNTLGSGVEDEWVQNQCQSFTQWLNYTFEPTEDKEVDEVDTSLDRVSLRALVVHRRMARVRAVAMDVYKGPAMVKARKIITAEIQRGRIAIRKDRNLHADLTMRNQIMALLFSYSIPWLRLGLETLFGEPIMPMDPQQRKKAANSAVKLPNKLPISRMKMTLKSFIIGRVLSDDKLLKKYTRGKCMVPSGSFEQKYNTELNTLVLHRLLVLIFFLDAAKKAHILDKVPNLFQIESEVKSTREVLLAFCRDFLQSEGDFVKHLSRLGLQVSYKQEPVDELVFTVTNLAADLRDGTRLAKLTELLTAIRPKSLLVQLRLPVVSRLQKLHNVGIALKELICFGVPVSSDIAAHHIVDGHRPIVLKLMWTIVAHCCLRKLLDIERVEIEIERISRKKRKKEIQISESVEYDVGQLKDVLIRWCQAICSRVGIRVRDLTKDFASGKVVCNLIHFYHPTLLRLNEISCTSDEISPSRNPSHETVEKLYANERTNASLANKRMSELGGIPQMIPICDSSNPPDEKSMLFCLTFLCSRLIESSVEIRACVTIQTWFRPFYNKIVFQRKSSAAIVILRAWRANSENFYREQAKKYKASVLKIENFMASNRAGLTHLTERRILKEGLHRAAVLIQKIIRRFVERRRFFRCLQLHRCTIILQSLWRSRATRRIIEAIKQKEEAAVIIQYFWKVAKIRKECRNHAATQIQRVWRGFWSQLKVQIDLYDIIAVQSYARRKLAKAVCYKRLCSVVRIQNAARRFLRRRSSLREFATIKIQSAGRSYLAKRKLKAKRSTTKFSVFIQSHWRKHVAIQAKNLLLAERSRIDAAILIQSLWRRHASRVLLLSYKAIKVRVLASLLIQSLWRVFKAKSVLENLYHRKCVDEATVTLQCFVRVLHAQKIRRDLQQNNVRYQKSIIIQSLLRSGLAKSHTRRIELAVDIVSVGSSLAHSEVMAAITIQKTWRRKLANICLQSLHSAATTLQSLLRMVDKRRFLTLARFNAIIIQSRWRSTLSSKSYMKSITNVVRCQSVCRTWIASREYIRRDRSIRRIQCFVRQSRARSALNLLKQIKKRRNGATVILQRSWRKFFVKARYQSTKKYIVFIQSLFRRMKGMEELKLRYRAVMTIQNSARVFLACKRFKKTLSARIEKERAEKNAAVLVQSAFRGACIRQHYSHLHLSARTIQCVFRGFLQRADYNLLILDVILTQTIVRRWIAKRMMIRKLNSKICLQAFLRGCLVRIGVRRVAASCTLQRIYRGHLARNLASRHFAARQIQKTWRCYDVHCNFMLVCLQTIKMEACVRRCSCMRSFSRQRAAIVRIQSFARLALVKIMAFRKDRAAVTLQAFARMVTARLSFIVDINQHRSASILQSFFRMVKCKSTFSLEKIAVILIQRVSRGLLVRTDIAVQNYAVTEIQRVWKGYCSYIDYSWKLWSAVKLQSFLRMVEGKQITEKLRSERTAIQFLKVRSSMKIQRIYRQFQHRKILCKASSQIQHAFRSYLARAVFSKLRRRIAMFQSVFRGKNVRAARSQKIRLQAARIIRANANAKADPKMQLGTRTKSALSVLRKSRSLIEIMNAICLLEFATRYSEACCIAFAQAGAPDILFPLIRSCNRSIPHIQIVGAVLLTLANVAKYESLLPSMASVVGAEVILDLVQMFRDKEDIFPLASSLLERIVSNSDEVKIRCTSRETRKRLKSIVQLVNRKFLIACSETPFSTHDEISISTRTRSAKKRTNKDSTPLARKRNCSLAALSALQRVLEMTAV